MSSTILLPLVLCILSLGMEALCAGRGIRHRFAELRMPRYAPPLWGWVAIALFYYAMSFTILFRLLAINSGALRNVALTLMIGLMVINAAWNYFFFRSRNLRHAFLIGLPYGVVALLLLYLLWRLDRTAAAWLAPYLVYLLYANRWGYLLWKLNRGSS